MHPLQSAAAVCELLDIAGLYDLGECVALLGSLGEELLELPVQLALQVVEVRPTNARTHTCAHGRHEMTLACGMVVAGR